MITNRFQHVDIRVTDLAAARAFYSRLMPALDFPIAGGSVFTCFSAQGPSPEAPWFGFIEDRDHRPNANRIAFRADSRADVDRLAQIVGGAGGRITSGPRACPEYSESYYAVFFQDPCGNCLEIVHLTD